MCKVFSAVCKHVVDSFVVTVVSCCDRQNVFRSRLRTSDIMLKVWSSKPQILRLCLSRVNEIKQPVDNENDFLLHLV